MWGWGCQDVFRIVRRINKTFGIRGNRKRCEYSMSCLAASIRRWQVLEGAVTDAARGSWGYLSIEAAVDMTRTLVRRRVLTHLPPLHS